MRQLPTFCASCRELSLASTDMHRADDVRCARCGRRATVLSGPVLGEASLDWFARLRDSLTPDQVAGGPLTMDVLRLLMAHPEIEDDDAGYLLRRVAKLEGVALPTNGQLRAAIQLLVAVFEASNRGRRSVPEPVQPATAAPRPEGASPGETQES